MATKKTAKAKDQSKLSVVETKKTQTSLVIEPHPKDYVGFPFITLLQYRKTPLLAIVDNMTDSTINAYILDLCGPERVDEEMIIRVASEWYNLNRWNFPLSIEFSRRDLTSTTMRLYRTLNMEFVSRVIGPAPIYPMNTIKSIKRRRRKPVPAYLAPNVVSPQEFSN